MPLPKPKKGETQKDFVSRCMGDEIMKKDYDNLAQRLAVCYQQFTRKKGKGEKDENVDG